MSFFAKLFNHVFQDYAVNKLASNKHFQNFAVKTVEAQKAVEQLAKEAAADPDKALKTAKNTGGSFLEHFKAEVMKDLGKLSGEGAPAQQRLAANAKVAADEVKRAGEKMS